MPPTAAIRKEQRSLPTYTKVHTRAIHNRWTSPAAVTGVRSAKLLFNARDHPVHEACSEQSSNLAMDMPEASGDLQFPSHLGFAVPVSASEQLLFHRMPSCRSVVLTLSTIHYPVPSSPAFLARSSRICNFLSIKNIALVILLSDMPASSAAFV
jgi:hypothetical protein